MSLGLPADVNISPASLRPDLWLWEVSAVSRAKQSGSERRHSFSRWGGSNIFSSAFYRTQTQIHARTCLNLEVLFLCTLSGFSVHQPCCLFSDVARSFAANKREGHIVFTFPWPLSPWISKQTSSWWRWSRRLEVVPPRAKLLSGPGSPPAQEVKVLGCCWLSGLFLRQKMKLRVAPSDRSYNLRTAFQNPLNAQSLTFSSDVVGRATSIPAILVVTTRSQENTEVSFVWSFLCFILYLCGLVFIKTLKREKIRNFAIWDFSYINMYIFKETEQLQNSYLLSALSRSNLFSQVTTK